MDTPCRNCGEPVTGRFCAHCGQSASRSLRPFHVFLRDTAADVFDLDGRLAQTLWRLLRHPGRLTAEYAAGRFGAQVPPTRLYLGAAAVYYMLTPFLGSGGVRVGTGETAYWGPLTWHSRFLLLLMVPLWAVAARVALVGGRRYFEEVFVFSVHYHVVFILWLIALSLFVLLCNALSLAGAAFIIVLLSLIPLLLYLIRALDGAFGLGPVRRVLTGLALFIIQLFIGGGLASLLGVGFAA